MCENDCQFYMCDTAVLQLLHAYLSYMLACLAILQLGEYCQFYMCDMFNYFTQFSVLTTRTCLAQLCCLTCVTHLFVLHV